MGLLGSIHAPTRKVASRVVSHQSHFTWFSKLLKSVHKKPRFSVNHTSVTKKGLFKSNLRVEKSSLHTLALGVPATTQNPTHSLFRFADQTPALCPRICPRHEANFVVVWDFDWSMINQCVDYWFLQQFGTTSALIDNELKRIKSERNGRVPSPELMDNLFLFMFDNFGVAAETIFQKVVDVPVFKENLELIRFLHVAGIPQWIVSDANQLFIQKILEYHGISECFAEIHTNVGWIEANGCLRVDPYVRSHDCQLSHCLDAPNLCKGSVMRLIKNRYSDGTKFCFVGDGSGDFCAGVHLEANHTFFVRTGRSLEKLVKEDLTTRDGLLTCQVVLWDDGADLQREVMARALDLSFPHLSSSIQENTSAALATW